MQMPQRANFSSQFPPQNFADKAELVADDRPATLVEGIVRSDRTGLCETTGVLAPD
jgi:hypothetical protein